MKDEAFEDVMRRDPLLLERLARHLILVFGDGPEQCKISSAEALQYLCAVRHRLFCFLI